MKKMKKCKWTYELIAVAVLFCIVGGACWLQATWASKDQRQADAQFEQLVRFANRQQVEIAIIKQATELRWLKAEIQKAQQPVPPTVPPPIIPQLPQGTK